MNKKISTSFGTVILITIVSTLVYFIWMYEKIQTLSLEQEIYIPRASISNKRVPESSNVVPAKLTNPKKKEITSWKSYKNEKYGFEIKYPVEYSLFQDTDQRTAKTIPATPESSQIIVTDNPEMFFCCEPLYFSVEVLDAYVSDFPQWIKEKNLINEDNSYRVESEGYVDFIGERAYQVKADSGIDSPGDIILVNHDSKTYYIHDNSGEDLEDIISSFKFIK